MQFLFYYVLFKYTVTQPPTLTVKYVIIEFSVILANGNNSDPAINCTIYCNDKNAKNVT